MYIHVRMYVGVFYERNVSYYIHTCSTFLRIYMYICKNYILQLPVCIMQQAFLVANLMPLTMLMVVQQTFYP